KKPQFSVHQPSVRRFELPDIMAHSKWLQPRLMKAYPHLTDPTAVGFLRHFIYSAEYYFCFQPHAVGLVQVERGHMLTPDAIVREKFVWVEDPRNEEYVDEALDFYDEFVKWGERLDAKVLLVGEHTDVPIEKLRKVFQGQRIHTREQHFVRLGK